MKAMIRIDMCSQSRITRQDIAQILVLLFTTQNFGELTCHFCKAWFLQTHVFHFFGVRNGQF